MQQHPTPTTLQYLVTVLFFGTWFVLAFFSFIVFIIGANAELKRTWFPRVVIFAGVVIVIFISIMTVLNSRSGESLCLLVFVIPAVAAVSYLNIRLTKFCGSCGATLFKNNWFSPTRFCSSCGASLEEKSKTPNDPFE
jgi:hypothetical protein